MIALDTNVLVHAHRKDSPWHEDAFRVVGDLAEDRLSWAIPWPCLHEFLAVATHPRVWDPPTPLEDACAQIEFWRESPSLVLLGETGGYLGVLNAALTAGKVQGARVHDAHIAALCIHHGVEELLTLDRDFERFPALCTRNPLM